MRRGRRNPSNRFLLRRRIGLSSVAPLLDAGSPHVAYPRFELWRKDRKLILLIAAQRGGVALSIGFNYSKIGQPQRLIEFSQFSHWILLQLLESELVVGPWWNQIPLLKKDVLHLPILLQNPIVEVAQIRPLQRLPAKHGCKRFARGLKHDVGITVKVHELRPRKHLQE